MPAVGKQNTTFSPNFTQHGKRSLEVPCNSIHIAGVTYWELAQAPNGQEPISIGYFACSMAIWAAPPLLLFLFLFGGCFGRFGTGQEEGFKERLEPYLEHFGCILLCIPFLYVIGIIAIYIGIPFYTILCAGHYLIYSDEDSATKLNLYIPPWRMFEQVPRLKYSNLVCITTILSKYLTLSSAYRLVTLVFALRCGAISDLYLAVHLNYAKKRKTYLLHSSVRLFPKSS